jgi:hypothetical protein
MVYSRRTWQEKGETLEWLLEKKVFIFFQLAEGIFPDIVVHIRFCASINCQSHHTPLRHGKQPAFSSGYR